MDKLTQEQIEARLGEIPEWSQLNDSITRTFQFDSFPDSMGFVNEVAREAETAQHHPDILIRWNKVTLTLSTHDAGGITRKDFELASKADTLSVKAS